MCAIHFRVNQNWPNTKMNTLFAIHTHARAHASAQANSSGALKSDVGLSLAISVKVHSQACCGSEQRTFSIAADFLCASLLYLPAHCSARSAAVGAAGKWCACALLVHVKRSVFDFLCHCLHTVPELLLCVHSGSAQVLPSLRLGRKNNKRLMCSAIRRAWAVGRHRWANKRAKSTRNANYFANSIGFLPSWKWLCLCAWTSYS